MSSQDIDDEAKLREIDFTQFEELFKLQSKEESKESRDKRIRALEKVNSRIHFVEVNRAKNMSMCDLNTSLFLPQLPVLVSYVKFTPRYGKVT